jgi:putative ABC transport system permease protein
LILNKRIFRELKHNFIRYLALFVLIATGLGVISGMAASVDSIVESTTEYQERCNMEDGSFSLFVPMMAEDIKDLSIKGVKIEENFYLDMEVSDESTLRVFKNRNSINLLEIIEGNYATDINEVVLEKLYVNEKQHKIGDTITIGNENYTITGLGCVPDYIFMLKNSTDVAKDLSRFSIAFVNNETFNKLSELNDEKVEYNYSFKIVGDMTDTELKEYLSNMDFDTNKVTNKYMLEIIDEVEKNTVELTREVDKLSDGSIEFSEAIKEYLDGTIELDKGIGELKDGTDEYGTSVKSFVDGTSDLKSGMERFDSGVNELNQAMDSLERGGTQLTEGMNSLVTASNSLVDGLSQLESKNTELNQAADQVLIEIIKNAGNSLKGMGLTINLTKENYSDTLTKLIQQLKAVNPEQAEAITNLKTQIDNYALFCSALNDYTKGVSEVKEGSSRLNQGTINAATSTGSLADGITKFGSNIDRLNTSSKELNDGVSKIYDASTELKDGTQDITNGTDELKEGSNKLVAENEKILDGSTKLKDGTKELKNEINKTLEENLNFKYENLMSFLNAKNNARINNYADDAKINKSVALIVGVFFMLLISYILSVFVVQNIEQESAVIGTLYSMGYVKKELLQNFMLLPVLIVSLGSIVGVLLGYILIPVLAVENSTAFSYPAIYKEYNTYLLVFGLVLPILFTIIVNYFLLNRKLSQSPLKMLRKEVKMNKINNIDLKNMRFINCYRIRQLLREIRINITLFMGLFLAIMIMMIGFCTKSSIDNYIKQTSVDMNYEYMYMLKYPPKEAPKDTEIGYTEGLVTDFYITGENIDVTLQGIVKDSAYFDGIDEYAKDEIIISTSAVEKLGLKIGDKIVLTDDLNCISYRFTVVDVVDFTNGLYMFMNIDSMRDLFNQDEDYFNTLFSSKEIDMEQGRIQTIVSTKSVNAACSQFVSLMEGTILLLIIMSILVFVITMYLLVKVMIDKSRFNISLIKVFGYNKKEIKKIYLGSGSYTIFAAALVSLPLSKAIMNTLYPYLISNFASGMKVYVSHAIYAEMIGIIFGTYFIVNYLLGRHLNKISLVEILKDRE